MNKVYACIDGLTNTPAVIDWATWSALRLDAPLELLHVLERPTRPQRANYSGAIGLGEQQELLAALSELDIERGKLVQQAGRHLLDAACERALAAGAVQPHGSLRHGDLLETIEALEPDARLWVLGAHEHTSTGAKIHLDHHVERVIRTVERPVLVVTGEQFAAPQRAVIAFDASPTACAMVETVARSPLLKGLPLLLAMAGSETAQAREQLAQASQTLEAAGFEVQSELLPGEPEAVLPGLLKAQDGALLVMGAYGHSRIRQLIVGSTTSTLLRLSEVPVLILR